MTVYSIVFIQIFGKTVWNTNSVKFNRFHVLLFVRFFIDGSPVPCCHFYKVARMHVMFAKKLPVFQFISEIEFLYNIVGYVNLLILHFAAFGF